MSPKSAPDILTAPDHYSMFLQVVAHSDFQDGGGSQVVAHEVFQNEDYGPPVIAHTMYLIQDGGGSPAIRAQRKNHYLSDSCCSLSFSRR